MKRPSCRPSRGSPTTWPPGRRLLQSPPARIAGKLPGLSQLSAALTTGLRPLAEIDRAHHSARWLAGRQRFARAEPHSPRAGAPAAGDRREPPRRAAQALERWRPRRKTSSPFAATASSFPSAQSSSGASPAWCTAPVPRARRSTWSLSKPSSRTTNSSGSSKRSRPRFIASLSRSRARLAATRTALVEGARVLALVDSLQARARFARDYDCVAPASYAQICCASTPPAIRCSKSICAPPAGASSRSRSNSPPQLASSSSAAPTPAARP